MGQRICRRNLADRLPPISSIQAHPIGNCSLDLRDVFNSDWGVANQYGRVQRPPWRALRENRAGGVGLWSVEDQCDWLDDLHLEVKAQKMLSNPAAAHLIEIDRLDRFSWGFCPAEWLNEWLEEIISPSLSSSWTPVQRRQRAAHLLAMVAGAAQYTQKLTITVGDVNSALSTWEFGAEAVKLAWKLLQPRRGGVFDSEELSVDALMAASTLVDSLRPHPTHLAMSLQLKRYISDKKVYDTILQQTRSDPVLLEVFKRCLTFHMRETVAYRLWHERNAGITFRHLLQPLGPLRFFEAECVDELKNGSILRQSARLQLWMTKLDLLNEEILDSPLMDSIHETTLETRILLIRQREDAARAMLPRLVDWKAQALKAEPAVVVTPMAEEDPFYHPNFSERQHTDQMGSSFITTLDLIAASLQEIGAHELAESFRAIVESLGSIAPTHRSRTTQ